MKALRETGKTLTVDIRDVVKLFRFVKDFMNWDFDFYHNYLKGIDPSYENRDWYFPTLIPRFLILPDYRYSPIDPFIKEQGKIKGNDPSDKKIRFENFSTFNIFEIVNDPDSPIINIFMSLMVDQYKNTRETKITGLSLDVTFKDRGISVFPLKIHPHTYSDVKLLEDSLKTLSWAKGRQYSFRISSRRHKVVKNIMTLEDTMIATLNFLYTTYTGEYEVNKESKLFEPLTELLQSYGNTFEDVLEVIKGIVTLIG